MYTETQFFVKKQRKLIYTTPSWSLFLFYRYVLIARRHYRSLHYTHNLLKQLCNLSLKKNRTQDLCDTGTVLYQLSYEANWELVTTFNNLQEITFFLTNICFLTNILRASGCLLSNDVKNKNVCHGCSYHILMSSVIHF